MKFHSLILAAIVFAASCNTQPKSGDASSTAADTTGLAEYQAMKAQNELGITSGDEQKDKKSSSKTVAKTTSVSNNKSASDNNSTSSPGTTQKKGWSKTAKGAVIGGVVGAGTGAVVNKKNRAAGAVIGGVIGAGTGAVIGNKMDKKDGRH